jgi:hypothetical protein
MRTIYRLYDDRSRYKNKPTVIYSFLSTVQERIMPAISQKAIAAGLLILAVASPAYARNDAADRGRAIELCRAEIAARTGIAADKIVSGDLEMRATTLGVRFAAPDADGKARKVDCVMRRSTGEIVTLDLPAGLPRATQATATPEATPRP